MSSTGWSGSSAEHSGLQGQPGSGFCSSAVISVIASQREELLEKEEAAQILLQEGSIHTPLPSACGTVEARKSRGGGYLQEKPQLPTITASSGWMYPNIHHAAMSTPSPCALIQDNSDVPSRKMQSFTIAGAEDHTGTASQPNFSFRPLLIPFPSSPSRWPQNQFPIRFQHAHLCSESVS